MMTRELINLSVRRCLGCGALSEAAASFCAHCLGESFEEVIKPGTGQLASWTTIRKPPLAFKERGPYEVAVVDLDAGLRVTGHLLPEGQPSVGHGVELVEQEIVQGQVVNVFRLAR